MNEKPASSDFLQKLGLGVESPERAAEVAGAFESQGPSGDVGSGQPGPDESQPRKTGRKRKWLKIPVGRLDQNALAALPGDIVSEAGLRVDSAPDDQGVAQLVSGLIAMVNEVGAAVMEQVALRKTGDADFAKRVADASRMSPKVEGMIHTGGVGCFKKYALSYSYVEETALCGGLLLWGGSLYASAKMIQRMPGKEQDNDESATSRA